MAENFVDLDVIIIGGGPAGISSLFWCTELGLRAIIFEKEIEFGGQLLWTFNSIKNYLGIEAANGRTLRDKFLQHIENTDVRRVTGAEIISSDLTQKTVILADGRRFSANSIIIATGVRRRELEISGEQEFRGRGILDSGAKAKKDVQGKKIAIVGGGDAALENALILSETANKVIVVHRSAKLSARNDFVSRAVEREKIEFLLNTRVTAIIGNKEVEAIELEDRGSGKPSRIEVDHVLIRIGVVPNTEMFRGQVTMDGAHYICVDSQSRTGLDGIFAAGDVANPISPTIGSAVGQGATAIKTIFSSLTE